MIARFFVFALGLMALVLASVSAQAQTTLRADWTNLGKSSLQAVSDGDELVVGPNRVTVSTTVVRDGDANDANFVPNYSTEMLAYFAGQISSQTGGLLYTTDHTVFDVGDYFESIYTLDTSVAQLAFTVGNVDRFFGTDGSGNRADFHDGVIIHYDNGDGTWRNLRNLTSAYTLGSAVGTTTLNGTNGFHGIAYSGGITSTTGDIRVAFGTTTVKRVRIRYLFGQANPTVNPIGNWQYMGLSDFTWQQNIQTADLSLSKTVSNSAPVSGSTISYTLTLLNSGANTASNVTVSDPLPAGFTFTSPSGYGSFDASTGIWTVPSIASGQSRQIVLTGTVSAPAGVTITNIAEVATSPLYDPDSTPGNDAAGEDDRASVSFTVQGTRTAGTPPTLICPKGAQIFDWAGRSWPEGSTDNTYAFAGVGSVRWTIDSPAPFLPIAAYGGIHPRLTTAAQSTTSLSKAIDFDNRTQLSTTTVKFDTVVDGAQFVVFDVDFAAGDFADFLRVYGRRAGTTTVIPVLTNGVSNYVIGNEAFGDQTSADTSADGNVTVTFSEPIDEIIIQYGNHSLAPADPDGQAIQMSGGISICAPEADLVVTKTSEVLDDLVSDPANGPFHIPGARIRYCILITNPDTGTAYNIEARDVVPTSTTFISGTIRSGTSCSAAATEEDDDTAGADDTDGFSGWFASGTVGASIESLAGNSTSALTFEATID